MDDEVELISDGAGLAIVGRPSAVERFISSVGLSSERESPRLGAVLSAGSSAAQAGSEIAANSGRWVKLTEESAKAVKKFGLMDTETRGVKHAMVGQRGDIKQWIQIVKAPGTILTNPAMLAGAAGIMTQLAMQQNMDEITDYLKVIDEKLDEVLRTHKNQVLARMDGVDLAVQEAMSLRERVERVSDVTWSKVQSSSVTILETQALALRQLRDLAEKLEKKTKVADLAKTAEQARPEVEKLLAILARCFQLHDAIAILELDRVLDASPQELDRHRLGLQGARSDRLELISRSTEQLLDRMNAAVELANGKVLFHPRRSPAVARSRNLIAAEVNGFHELLGLGAGSEATEGRRWTEAAGERLDSARETGGEGVDSVKRFGAGAWGSARETGGEGVDALKQFGVGAVGKAKSARDAVSERVAGRRQRTDDEERSE